MEILCSTRRLNLMSDTQKYTIQPATLSDLNHLRELEKLCFEKDAWPLLELIAALTLPGMIRLKIDIDGKMAGFIGGDTHRTEKVGWITTVGVRPEHRRLGLATQLIAACESAMQMPFVRLSVRRSNLAAQRLYVDLGYRHIDAWSGYYEDGEDALIMEKIITSVS
jgi:ribosomal-protein-alanine N-acetyltransferase